MFIMCGKSSPVKAWTTPKVAKLFSNKGGSSEILKKYVFCISSSDFTMTEFPRITEFLKDFEKTFLSELDYKMITK